MLSVVFITVKTTKVVPVDFTLYTVAPRYKEPR